MELSISVSEDVGLVDAEPVSALDGFTWANLSGELSHFSSSYSFLLPNVRSAVNVVTDQAKGTLHGSERVPDPRS